MRFFVPHAKSEEAESVYESLAQWCGADVPPPEERLASIEFTRRCAVDRDRRRAVARLDYEAPETEVGHGRVATVLAIFAGNPYLVVTNARPLTDLVRGG